MKILIQFTLGVATAGLLALGFGCQTRPVHKPGFDFSHYRTFAIQPLPTTAGTPRDPSLVARLGPTVRQAVEEKLAGKGFNQVPQSEADFQVRLLFDYVPVAEDELGRHERRTLEIDILDGKSNEVVWSNWRQRTTDLTLSPESVRKVVGEMLKPFPPGA